MVNKLEQLQKQNNGMFNNLVKNGVSFNRETPPSESGENQEILMDFYQKEQQELKNALMEFRKNQPKPEPKKKNKGSQPKAQKKSETKDDEIIETPKKPNYPTIANMEDLKRAFFNDEIESFNQLVKEQPYLFFEAKYKYESDMDGRPDYVARNFVKGFINNLDDYRKYFLTCFRCYDQSDNKYSYPSLWIVNTNSSLKEVTEDYSEDFIFTQIDKENLDDFLQKFQKSNEKNLINESYLH